jgi:RND superfamily putative drug exporter
MVEARARGMTTEEAIRHGTATTGRLISAAALVLVVVGGAFAFSDLVMMQYLAIGLITALLLDATVVRMFLVPSIMKLLGNDCWWAPQWMKRVQERIGLGEITLEDERKAAEPVPEYLDETMAFGTVVGAPAWHKPWHDPSRPVAAAAASSGSASAVALADPPSADPAMSISTDGEKDKGSSENYSEAGGFTGPEDTDDTPSITADDDAEGEGEPAAAEEAADRGDADNEADVATADGAQAEGHGEGAKTSKAASRPRKRGRTTK